MWNRISIAKPKIFEFLYFLNIKYIVLLPPPIREPLGIFRIQAYPAKIRIIHMTLYTVHVYSSWPKIDQNLKSAQNLKNASNWRRQSLVHHCYYGLCIGCWCEVSQLNRNCWKPKLSYTCLHVKLSIVN